MQRGLADVNEVSRIEDCWKTMRIMLRGVQPAAVITLVFFGFHAGIGLSLCRQSKSSPRHHLCQCWIGRTRLPRTALSVSTVPQTACSCLVAMLPAATTVRGYVPTVLVVNIIIGRPTATMNPSTFIHGAWMLEVAPFHRHALQTSAARCVVRPLSKL